MTSKLPIELLAGSGTAGQVLTSNGPSSSPSMQTLNAVQTNQVSNFTKQQYFGLNDLGSHAGGALAWNVEDAQVAEVELTANTTLSAPTNPQAGGIYHILVKQDTIGGRTLTFDSNYKFEGGTPPTLTATASRADIYSFLYNGTYMLSLAVQQDLDIFVPIPVPDLDISTYSFTSTTFSVAAQETFLFGNAWGDSGNKMYICGWGVDGLTEYTAGTAYDISTLGSPVTANITDVTAPIDFKFKDDGLAFFVVEPAGVVEAFTLGVAWDISTWARDSAKDYNFSAQETIARAIDFSSDGFKMFIGGNSSDAIHEYALGTAWDPSTATFTTTFSTAAQTTAMSGMQFTNDGDSFVLCQNGAVFQYDLTTPYDLTTASYNQQLLITGGAGVSISPDNTVMIISDGSGSTDNLREYT